MDLKKNLFFFLLVLSGVEEIFSQPFPEQDCIAAIPVCQSTYVQSTPYAGIGSPTAGQGLNGNEINGQISCLATGETNDVWYTFTVQTNGSLCFNIMPSDTTDDYDWAVFNLSSSTCDDIFTNASLEVECNFSNIPGETGANGDTGTQYEPCIPVSSGETYVLNVSSFYQGQSGYTLDLSPSTAQLYDNIPPGLESVNGLITCGDTQLVVSFSENVLCATVQPTDFILKGPSGNIPVSNVTSIGCSNGSTYDNQFTLTISPAISPNGTFSLILLATAAVQDLCNNPNIKDDTVTFSISPFGLTMSTTPQLCSNNNGTATANPSGGISPYSYLWNTPTTQTTPTATGLMPGVYTVTVTDNVGCISTGAGNVGFDPGANPPVATISSSTNATCAGMNDGMATVSTSGGTTPYVYIWSNGQTTPTATGLATGISVCSVTDNNGCTDTASVSISGGVPIFVTAIPGDTSICKGGTANLSASASGGTNPFSFTWLVNGFPVGTNIPFAVSPSATTVYSVYATDNSGCLSDSDVVSVNVFPPIVVNISPVNIVCVGDSVNLKANAGGGKGSGYSYIWSNTTATGSEIYVKPNANTTYYVTVSDGCTTPDGIASVVVSVGQPPPALKIFANPLEGCIPLPVQFHIDPPIQGFIYMWDFGDGNRINTTSDTVNNTYTVPGCKNLSVSIITNEGCRDSVSATCLINPFPSPEADFTFFPSHPTTLNPVVNFYNRSVGAETWQWDLGDNSISNNQFVQHEYPDSGSYEVKLVVANDFQCTDTAVYSLYVDYESTFYLPNSFSPNEDEMNDVFGPSSEGIMQDGFNMRIFDRWGRMVYQSDNIAKPWDGKIGGSFARDGVYIYYIKYKTFEGEEKKIRGSVTLLK